MLKKPTRSSQPDLKGQLSAAIEEVERLRRKLEVKPAHHPSGPPTELLYRSLFDLAADSILVFDHRTLRVLDCNRKTIEQNGYTKEEMLKLSMTDLEGRETPRDLKAHVDYIVRHGRDSFETVLLSKDGEPRHFWVSASAIPFGDGYVIQSISRDITDQKTRDRALSQLVENIFEMNQNLRHLLGETDWIDPGDYVLQNIENEIVPYLARLKSLGLNETQLRLASLVESRLTHLASRSSVRLSARTFGLTPRELEVAGLIKNGLLTKEIADVLCISENAVAFHRQQIRKKAGLRNNKQPLRAFLETLSWPEDRMPPLSP